MLQVTYVRSTTISHSPYLSPAAPCCLLPAAQRSRLTRPSRSQYSNESYDYPPNIRESFADLGSTIAEKARLLSSATSPAEAQAALTAPPSAKPQPKTFSHATARAALASSSLLLQQKQSLGSEDPLAAALEKLALASERVGEARLAQDTQIQSRYLAGWNTTLNTNIMFATRARKNVENARLLLDAAKTKTKPKPGSTGETQGVSDESRLDVEHAEDEFVGQTEEAVSVMKNVGSRLSSSSSAPSSLDLEHSSVLSRSSTPAHGRMLLMILTNRSDSRHSRAPSPPGGAHRRPARLPQESVRDPERARSGD